MQYVEYGAHNSQTIILLHGGGLSWWNYREVTQLLADKYHVVLPILDGHADSDAPFNSIEDTAAKIISHIDEHFGGKVLAVGGLSLGGQIAVEMLTQRSDICRFALLESALVKPSKLTHARIKPPFGMSYGLIKQKRFAKLQAAYLGIPKKLFDDYFRDTQAKVHIVFGIKEQASIRASGKLLHDMIPNSTLKNLPGFRHGNLSLNYPEQYTQMLLQMIS